MIEQQIETKSSRAYFDAPVVNFLQESADSIVGAITSAHAQDIVHAQTNAWRAQIALLKRHLVGQSSGHIFFEFTIPRMGNRADVVLLVDGIVFVLEFKIGSSTFHSEDLRQAEGYALDLKHFHEGSHTLPIVTILLATEARPSAGFLIPGTDDVYLPIGSNGHDLSDLISRARTQCRTSAIDPIAWAAAPYKPTPTIIEAAQALYSNHSVHDIARNDAGATNLTATSSRLREIIEHSHRHQRKSICFVTGVPGAGKTLVGLDIATSTPQEEDAVFLSGNGPLVEVLREALARDEVKRSPGLKKATASQKVKSFIQNIHHFRDEALATSNPPTERVVVFDEAQRAWDRTHTAKFMMTKRGQASFDLSEPEFLIQIMDRHVDWCVIIALIGGGQEINSGEIGLVGWHDAIRDRFPDWDVYFSDKLNQAEYAGGSFDITDLANGVSSPEPVLHLATSMRSFRAESLSAMIHHLIAGNAVRTAANYGAFSDNFPIRVTRNIERAKDWIRNQARGVDTKGLIASSGAIRLKPHGVFVKNQLSPADWFLNGPDDVRSCHYLEDVATEFDIQGLELDWCLVAWDADYRYRNGQFEHWNFSGTRWNQRNQDAARRYLQNAYRVLLTRARQGMVIFVPEGDPTDQTRLPTFYDQTYTFLLDCGIQSIS
jgi:schlafen family protein